MEKQIRICIEIYLSKIQNVDSLINIMDYLMANIQEEILSQNDNQMFNFEKIKCVIEVLVNPTIYFIKLMVDEDQ